MSIDDWDFGFTAMDADELDVVQDIKKGQENASNNAEKFANDLLALRKAIQPLLNNLRANPEKDFIHWPDRVEKVDAFEAHINKYCEI